MLPYYYCVRKNTRFFGTSKMDVCIPEQLRECLGLAQTIDYYIATSNHLLRCVLYTPKWQNLPKWRSTKYSCSEDILCISYEFLFHAYVGVPGASLPPSPPPPTNVQCCLQLSGKS